MALVSASRGQQASVPFYIQFTNATGQASDPDAAPSLEIIEPVSGTVKATLTPTKLGARAGFYGTLQSVADPASWPAGTYVLRWAATIGGIATATTDTFQLFEAGDLTGTGALAGAYCTEAQIRAVSFMLAEELDFPDADVAAQAAAGATYINGKLSRRFAVPFASPFPSLVVLLNAWLAAAYLLEWKKSERGNTHPFAQELLERAEGVLEDLANGVLDIGVLPLPTAGTSRLKVSTSGLRPDFLQEEPVRSTRLSKF